MEKRPASEHRPVKEKGAKDPGGLSARIKVDARAAIRTLERELRQVTTVRADEPLPARPELAAGLKRMLVEQLTDLVDDFNRIIQRADALSNQRACLVRVAPRCRIRLLKHRRPW